ncbi:short-chain fatty acyl-CoA regulator family protein [Pelagibacterium sp. 26DY04]|uniref:helix-turn-helix domain-containing protein n=1 Tax=Pelagibacterium sp. 26DY04 TaxID=2967130 RepID=UPI0028153890|nr:short-chain fatty acyl-CoA regulator family protein [Pelagibacterium sp. 26DY04]WMT85437.1 short-chain fatty acyl-CoA regulator family protein [Pelagibacterium sp. 26DY04]
MSQAALARSVGISPSYLNLIEANKRQVGGTLLQRIAAELEITIGELTGEAEHRLIHELTEAFADPVLADVGLSADQARSLVATQPQIAQMIARLHRAYAAAAVSADAYANRLRADPLLSQLLHQVLSRITAVRSSAEILDEIKDLSSEERERFVGSISREARGLTAVAQNLIGQFDHASIASRSASVRRELDDMIFAARNYFPLLEDRAAEIAADLGERAGEAAIIGHLRERHGIAVERTANPPSGQPFAYDAERRTIWFRNTVPQSTRQFQMVRLVADLTSGGVLDTVAGAPELSSETARKLARAYLSSYAAGAVLFPYERFRSDAEALRYDVEALSERYNASFEQVAHRLVTLRREDAEGVPFGFLRSDPAGRLTKHFPLPGLLLPQTGHACPLWAIYAAFRSSGQLVRQVVRFSDGSRFLFIAKAVSRRSSGFADQALPHSILLATDILHADRTVYADGLDLRDSGADVPVGPSCRLCTRADCPSRQEAPFAPGTEATLTGSIA